MVQGRMRFGLAHGMLLHAFASVQSIRLLGKVFICSSTARSLPGLKTADRIFTPRRRALQLFGMYVA